MTIGHVTAIYIGKQLGDTAMMNHQILKSNIQGNVWQSVKRIL